MLTIAIPTFNRNHLLNGTVSALFPQLREGVQVTVFDNASDRPVSETLPPLPPNVHVIRNRVNLGGNGNILRCIECCQTEWIWILGDDDLPEPDAVDIIMDVILSGGDLSLLNYCKRGERFAREDRIVDGVVDLIALVPRFGQLLFISASVYRVSALRKYMDFGYHYSYSCGPHLAMLLLAFSKEKVRCLISHRALISSDRPIVENRGSLVPIALGLPALLELPISPIERRVLARGLARFPRISAVAHQIFLQIMFAGLTGKQGRRIFLTILHRLPLSASASRRLSGYLWWLAMCAPYFSYHIIVKKLYKLTTGHESGSHKLGLDRL